MSEEFFKTQSCPPLSLDIPFWPGQLFFPVPKQNRNCHLLLEGSNQKCAGGKAILNALLGSQTVKFSKQPFSHAEERIRRMSVTSKHIQTARFAWDRQIETSSQ